MSASQGYYTAFPGSSYDVSITGIASPETAMGGQKVVKNVLVAEKDFSAGDVLYKEHPTVAALDSDLEGNATHCSRCFRALTEDSTVRKDDLLGSAYCSEACESQASTDYQSLLFGTMSDSAEPISEEHKAVQKKAAEFYKQTGKAGMMMVARFVARIVAESTRKLAAGGASLPNGGTEYTLVDHMERLRYLEFTEESLAEQKAIVSELLQGAAQGLQEFVQDDKYGVLLGKMAYNAIGVTPLGGRENRPESSLRPEDQEYTRSALGTNRQIGAGLYLISSYLQHSCAPNTRTSFPEGTNELQIVAERDIKKGEELSIAYVDITAASEDAEEVVNIRRNRRMALARGWRFACTCIRCAKEAPQPSSDATLTPISDDVKVEGPAAQMEASAMRFETGAGEAEFRSKETNNDDVE